MRRQVFHGAMALLFAGCSATPEPAESLPPLPLDGTKWTVTVTPDVLGAKKGEVVFEDTLVFEKGMVSMTECLRHGFKASPYDARPTADALSFTAQQWSEQEGSAFWNGEIKGNSIKGTFAWRKKDGATLRYTFDGR